MDSKSAKVAELLRRGQVAEALCAAKGFRLGMTRQERAALVRGAEAITYPGFYADLGWNPDDCVRRAVLVLAQVVGLTPVELAALQGERSEA